VDHKPTCSCDDIAAHARPSWYLDPLVAQQKKDLHVSLFRKWMPTGTRLAMKTDVFEEAFGADALLADLAPLCEKWIAMDVSAHTAQQAHARMRLPAAQFLVCDVRQVPLRSDSLDVIVSNSTLDHFDARRDFDTALSELARLLRPGGRLLITVDNPRNLLYHPLRWISKLSWSPFALGYTPSPAALWTALESAGLRVVATSSFIHNPRGLSTVFFWGLRRLAGARADRLIQWCLDLFARLDRLPTRGFTACFLAACAVRPDVSEIPGGPASLGTSVQRGRSARAMGDYSPHLSSGLWRNAIDGLNHHCGVLSEDGA